MKTRAMILTAIAFASFGVLSACGSDDVVGVNECSFVAEVTGLKDVYVVGEVSAPAVVSLRPQNPSASCDPTISGKVVKFASSDASVASVSPSGQVVALKPGTVTLSFAVDSKNPASKTITVIAATSPLRRGNPAQS